MPGQAGVGAGLGAVCQRWAPLAPPLPQHSEFCSSSGPSQHAAPCPIQPGCRSASPAAARSCGYGVKTPLRLQIQPQNCSGRRHPRYVMGLNPAWSTTGSCKAWGQTQPSLPACGRPVLQDEGCKVTAGVPKMFLRGVERATAPRLLGAMKGGTTHGWQMGWWLLPDCSTKHPGYGGAKTQKPPAPAMWGSALRGVSARSSSFPVHPRPRHRRDLSPPARGPRSRSGRDRRAAGAVGFCLQIVQPPCGPLGPKNNGTLAINNGNLAVAPAVSCTR